MSTSLRQSFDKDTAEEQYRYTHKIQIQLQIQLQLKIQILLQITWIAYVTWQKKAINKDGGGKRNGDKHKEGKIREGQAVDRVQAENCRKKTNNFNYMNELCNYKTLSPSLSLPIEMCKKFVKVFVDLFIRFFFCVFCKLLIPLFHFFLSSLPFRLASLCKRLLWRGRGKWGD